MITSGLFLIVFIVLLCMVGVGLIAALCGILFVYTGRSMSYDRSAKKMAKAGNNATDAE
jgi:membrane glycosyltransferase